MTPVAGDDLVFPSGAANQLTTNDLPAGTTYGSLSFTGSGGVCNIVGNTLRIGSGGVTATRNASVGVPVTLAAPQTWSVTNGSLQVGNNGLPNVDLAGQNLPLNAVLPGSGSCGFIHGAGNITKAGSGSWSLGGNSDFTGQVIVNEGTLSAGSGGLGAADNTPSNGTIVNSGATLDIQGTFGQEYIRLFGGGAAGAGALRGNGTLNGTVELADQSVMIRGGPIVLNGLVTGSGRLAFSNNVITLGSSGNNFAGPLVWDPSSPGVLRLGANNALPATIAVNLPLNADLDLNGKSQTIGSLEGAGRLDLGVLTGGGSLTITGPGTTTFSGTVGDGDGTIHQSGGAMTWTGFINFSGTYTLSGGTLQLTGRLGLASLNQSGGTFRIAGNGFAKSVTVNGGSLEPGGGTNVPRIETLTLTPAATYSEIIDTMVPDNAGRIEAVTSVNLGGSKLQISGNTAGLTRFYSVTMIQTNTSSLALSGQFQPPSRLAGFDFAVGYNPGTAFPVMLGVLGKPTTTTLRSSANPSVAGDNVTFTATVTAPPGETFSNGVTFKDGIENLAFAPVDGFGIATYATKALDAGSHAIQARYNGNDILAESASPPLTQSVLATAPPPAVTFEALPPVVAAGQSSTLTWTTTFATSVTIDNGLGAQALSGSLMVQPATTTTYMLTATGAGGTTVKMLTITVATVRHRAVRH